MAFWNGHIFSATWELATPFCLCLRIENVARRSCALIEGFCFKKDGMDICVEARTVRVNIWARDSSQSSVGISVGSQGEWISMFGDIESAKQLEPAL